MATTNDLKNGLVLNLDGELWTVVEFQHVKPGKGGAFVRTTLKNVLSGKVVDKTFNAGTKVDTATVDKRTMQYLYADGDDFRVPALRSGHGDRDAEHGEQRTEDAEAKRVQRAGAGAEQQVDARDGEHEDEPDQAGQAGARQVLADVELAELLFEQPGEA